MLIVGYQYSSSKSVSLIYIRQSTPLTILRLRKPDSEFTYITGSSSSASTIDNRVLTPRSNNYVMKVICSYCDTIAIGDTSYEYQLIWSQSSLNKFVSPGPNGRALSYTHRILIGLMITVNDRTLNLTTLYWCQIYSILQLSCFAIYQMESIPCHSGHMNPRSHLPRPGKCGQTKGWFVYVHSVDWAPIYWSLVIDLSSIWLCISWDAIVFWHWQHLISWGINHWTWVNSCLFGD